MRIGIPFILQFVASIAGQFCPGERVSSFSCTTELTHFWSGSALAGQCPSGNPVIDDVISLSGAVNDEGDTVPCGIFTANVTNAPMMGDIQLSSTISFTASSDLDGTEVVCTDGNLAEVERYPITIIGPPTAPDITMVNFTLPREEFTIEWDGTAVVSGGDVTGFQVDSPSGKMCEDTSSSPSAMESRCSWEESAVGQTHSICVSAINCGSQQGASDCVSVSLQVPEAPTLTACPVYDQSGPLLRIESSCTTVPAVVIADGVDGSSDVYTFHYNDGNESVIPSGQCTGGTCTDEFTPDPAVSQYTVSVAARNVVGEGPPDTAGHINSVNDRLGLTVDVDQKKFVCVLQSGFEFMDSAECEIIYGTDASYSNLPLMDTGSNTSTAIAVALTATLQARTTYYYIATATSGNVCARLQGSFTTACVPDGLVEEGSSVVLVDGDCDPDDPNDVGGVLISAGTGRACYTGTTVRSTAQYFCNCEDSYSMMPETTVTRVCLLDGNWSEPTVPQCQPRCGPFPRPVNDNSRFVGPIDCQPDNPLVNATYGCGVGKDDITIQFLTPADGECSWQDPPCKGPPTAPDITVVNFTQPREEFTIEWDGTAVVSDSDVTGFQVNSPSGITCDDTSSNPSAMESRCTWEPSVVGQTHSICVSAINCGSQQGASDCVSVNLQVPEAPTLTACPVYDQSGPLLRIESSCTTVPAVDIADGVDGSPDAYIFSYNDGDESVIPSGQCTGGTCTDEFTPDPAVSQYTVSVTARNVVAEGPPDTAGPFRKTNMIDITIILPSIKKRRK